MKILMCRPNYFDVKYEINPWMDCKKKVDPNAVLSQWETLYKTILNCGASVELVEQAPGCPDMVFTANAGMIYKNKVILSHFKYKERQCEQTYFENWFNQTGFEVITPKENPPRLFFEGAGDALQAGEKLFAGYGFRTQREFYEKVDFIDHSKLIYCELNDPRFYHLDTCFCPLNDNVAIWFPEAFTQESQQRMQENIELIPVIQDEAQRFACNAVVLGKHVVIPTQCPDITKKLEARGFTVHACEMNEFLKAGGACKCLTLRLD